MASCVGAGRTPRILPQGSEGLWCLARNHTSFRTSLKKGRVVQIHTEKYALQWPSVLQRSDQGQPLSKVAGEDAVPYVTVRPVLRAARKQSRGAHAHRMDEPPVQVACEQNELSMPSPGLLELSTLEWDSIESVMREASFAARPI